MYKSLKIIVINQSGEVENVFPNLPVRETVGEQSIDLLNNLFAVEDLSGLFPGSEIRLEIDGVMVKNWEWWLQLYTTDGISAIEDFVSRKLWLSEFLN